MAHSNDEHESAGKRLLEQAYRLETSEDNVAYYNQLAESYDEDFANGLGYALPQIVVDVYQALSVDGDSPVADIGCGTGLIGLALNGTALEIDGLDISKAMLEIARNTGAYRDVFEVDLNLDQSKFNDAYSAVLSSGTFTHGHLGPDAFLRLLDMGRSSALYVVAINEKHFEDMGFATAVEELIDSQRVNSVSTEQVRIYKQTDHAHGADTALILSFRKR